MTAWSDKGTLDAKEGIVHNGYPFQNISIAGDCCNIAGDQPVAER